MRTGHELQPPGNLPPHPARPSRPWGVGGGSIDPDDGWQGFAPWGPRSPRDEPHALRRSPYQSGGSLCSPFGCPPGRVCPRPRPAPSRVEGVLPWEHPDMPDVQDLSPEEAARVDGG